MNYLKSNLTDNFQRKCLVFKHIEYNLNEDQTIEEYIVVYGKTFTSQTEIHEGNIETELIKIGISQKFIGSSETEFESAIENKKKVIIE